MQRKFEHRFDQPPEGIAQEIVTVSPALLENSFARLEPNARRSERHWRLGGCPVGAQHAHGPEQAAFTMRAFLRAREAR
jgi:hypothetical protein